MDTAQSINTAPTRSPATGKGFSAMTSEEFSKIIFTELSNQDPMAPNDTNALLEQVSTLRSIQADTDLSDRLGSLVKQNQFAAATGMLGRRVGGVSESNGRVTGTVAGVTRTDDGPVLTLTTGERIRMSNLDEVRSPSDEPGRPEGGAE